MKKILFALLVLFSCEQPPREFDQIQQSLKIIDSLKTLNYNDTLLNKRLLMLENGFKTAHNELLLSDDEKNRKATVAKIDRLDSELFITLHQLKSTRESDM